MSRNARYMCNVSWGENDDNFIEIVRDYHDILPIAIFLTVSYLK